jgi:hypothetical protein
MPIVPPKPAEKITWYEAHIAPWTSHAVAIGSSAPEITALDTLTQSARAKRTAQQAAQDAARTATNEYREAVLAMAVAGSQVLKKVKAKAATTAGVWDLAQIPPPATPSPVGPPGMPTAFKVTLNPDGSLELTWKCSNPAGASGTIYQVSRKLGTSGGWQMIGGSGDKKFLDDSVPAGVASVAYRVQAVRSTQKGVANDLIVNFGVGGAGEMTASVETTPPSAGGAGGARMAA